jgi:predicted transcriptional regulator
MAITLSAEVQDAIESRMKEHGLTDPNELVLSALELLDHGPGVPYEELDEETRAAIEEGQAQIDAGLGRPWAEVDAELRARFVKKR